MESDITTTPSGLGSIAPTYGPRPLTLVKGSGIRVWDDAGNSYLDFTGGVAVNSLGHCHPAMRRALETQSASLIHCSNLFFNQPQSALASRLVELIGDGVVFFCNSGAEANEALIKLARKAGHPQGRFEIITATGSFHGRTTGGVAATGQAKIQDGFAPLMPGFIHLPFNDLAAVEAAMSDRCIAVLIEGIQGEGGIIPAAPEYLLGLRELTKQRDCLLLWDAVQCGGFRTGTFQSYSRLLEGLPGAAEFRPDAIAMAKSLGGGFPIGAAWIDARHRDVLSPGSHGSTFGGNPLACAVALAVLDEVRNAALDNNIREQGDYLLDLLRRRIGRSQIRAVRGLGGLIGMEMEGDLATWRTRCMEAGVLLAPAGNNTLRWLPPLNVSRTEIDQALSQLENIL